MTAQNVISLPKQLTEANPSTLLHGISQASSTAANALNKVPPAAHRRVEELCGNLCKPLLVNLKVQYLFSKLSLHVSLNGCF